MAAAEMNQVVPLKVLELYSGIGGMHFALEAGSWLQEPRVAAYDLGRFVPVPYQHSRYFQQGKHEKFALEAYNYLTSGWVHIRTPSNSFLTKTEVKPSQRINDSPDNPWVEGTKESGLQFEVIAAIDINTVTNDIYRHNFPQTRLINKGIETVKLKEFNKLAPDMILMSPPCQPFARVGKQKDVEDPRTKSFLHLLSIISRLDKPVSYILVENVKGFDTSEAHTQLLQTLKADYNIQEFLLSPLQCGVPNSRLRYYMLAKRKPCAFAFPCQDEIWTEFPQNVQHLLTDVELSEKDSSVLEPAEVPVNTADHTFADKEEKIKDNGTDNCCDSRDLNECDMPLYRKYSSICHPLREYLENGPPESLIPFMVPEKFFHRFWVMDIVKPDMKNCCCFTKRYGHHIEGAGSVIQTNMKSIVDLAKYKATREYCDETHESVRDLKLRFFSPREIANLMHFPAKFSFPEGVSTIQCYRVLGNSLNIHVVAVLLRLMLKDNS